jgi:hypothetical protein
MVCFVAYFLALFFAHNGTRNSPKAGQSLRKASPSCWGISNFVPKMGGRIIGQSFGHTKSAAFYLRNAQFEKNSGHFWVIFKKIFCLPSPFPLNYKKIIGNIFL